MPSDAGPDSRLQAVAATGADGNSVTIGASLGGVLVVIAVILIATRVQVGRLTVLLPWLGRDCLWMGCDCECGCAVTVTVTVTVAVAVMVTVTVTVTVPVTVTVTVTVPVTVTVSVTMTVTVTVTVTRCA